MSKRAKVSLFFVAILLVGAYIYGGMCLQDQEYYRREDIYLQGARACRAGLSIQTNPYVGYDAHVWIDGWVEAKERGLFDTAGKE